MGLSDTIVIGGGIIGASIAWRLRQAGLAVHLIEARTVGAGASTAGAGMLAPGGEVDQPGAFQSLLCRSASLYGDFVAELTALTGTAIDFRRCGALEMPGSPEGLPALLDRAARQREFGIRSSPAESGVWYSDDALVDPGDLMTALRTACLESGVSISEHTRVSRMDVSGSQVEIDGRKAHSAVIAAGAWSSRITVAGIAIPEVYPVKGHLLGYDLPPGSIPHIVRSGHTYVLQRSNGFAIAGSTEEMAGFDGTVDPVLAADLAWRARSLVPHLPEQPACCWTGFRPKAAEPAIGRVAGTRLWLAYGHFRNGILAAPATAEQIVREIAA